jgi:hypothetical protein
MPKTPQYVLNNQRDEDREKAHISKYKNFATQQKKGKAWYLPPARADILLRHSVTACSRWIGSLLASARAFSTFFALANADLVDFSAVVLAAVAASQAFLEASSSASRDEMRALAAAKSSAAQEEERKLDKRVTEVQR